MRETLPDARRSVRAAAAAILRRSFLAAVVAGTATPVFAQSPERWQVLDGEAQATLPKPRQSENVTALTLTCEARRWTLTLDMEGPTSLQQATLTVDHKPYELARTAANEGTISFRVPRAALEPLKSAVRAELSLTNEADTDTAPPTLALSLRGSHRAISALQERCTPRDMSAYDTVTFTPYSSYLELARSLRESDIATFELATASKPRLTAAMAEFGEGRRVLFTRLCGSSWYFGRSGCNITGFAFDAFANKRDGDTYEAQWRVVYDTENALVHTDPNAATDGWSDLVTLPVAGGGEGKIWRWSETHYVRYATLPDEDEMLSDAASELRPSHD